MYDLIIIGGGPAGLAAALYASRAELNTLLLERGMTGGQVITTHEVDNYPGFPKISGAELVMKMQEHVLAQEHPVTIRYEEVTDLDLGDTIKHVRTYEGDYEAKAVIYAAGATPRKLGVPGEDTFRGRGVSYCATCDGAFFKGKRVAVIGGGDTAAEDAVYLSRICDTVYVIVRKTMMRAAASLQRQILEKENVKLLTGVSVKEILGQEVVSGLLLTDMDGNERKLELDGVFAAVGVEPQTGLLKGKVNTCNLGYIECDRQMMTSIPGVFAAGDVTQKTLRQIITAASDGAVAVSGVLDYLNHEFVYK